MTSRRRDVPGTVYLIHFERPYRHARHYLGWTERGDARLDAHAAGRGSRLMAVVVAAGIGWSVARTWENATRARERSLKRQGGHSRKCPACRAEARKSLSAEG